MYTNKQKRYLENRLVKAHTHLASLGPEEMEWAQPLTVVLMNKSMTLETTGLSNEFNRVIENRFNRTQE